MRIAFLILFTSIVTLASAQHDEAFRVISWNAENLFDSRHDEGKEDYEFTPDGAMHWTARKMQRKIDDMARVIAQKGDSLPPDLIALCEVENERVMDYMTRWSPLGNLGYRYIMTSSADPRGIDVALLYQRERFRIISSQSISPLEDTRDILHVCGAILTGDTLDVIVTHMPSRRGGAKASEPKRMVVAGRLRQLCDSIFLCRESANIIIMGDFNDYPTNKSLRNGLRAKEPTASPKHTELYNLFLAREHRKRDHGSYKHQGEWGFLDQIIVSGKLLDSASDINTSPGNAGELRLPFLLTEDKKYGGDKPFRTINGYSYQGGVSDHLPVYADFIVHLPF